MSVCARVCTGEREREKERKKETEKKDREEQRHRKKETDRERDRNKKTFHSNIFSACQDCEDSLPETPKICASNGRTYTDDCYFK